MQQYPPNFSNFYSDQTAPGQFYPTPPPPVTRSKHLWRWYRSQKKRAQWGIGCGVLIAAMFLCMCSAALAAPSASQSQSADQTTPTTTATRSIVVSAATATPQPTPTHQVQAIPPLIPTSAAQPTPTPQTNPCPNAVNGNPWCYDFNPGNLIYSPPGAFCTYFSCISTFWNGRGFVNQCNDGEYSRSGGIRGDCSHHGGEAQPLYSH